jgi:iron complex outermembrane receptor protein
LLNFTFNAPASEHRGIEIAADISPAPGWRLTAAYTYNDQYYTDYVEQIGNSIFDREGNKIPGVSPNELVARLGYDQPSGIWKGFGGFLEYQWRDSFFVDNGNLLKAPGYDLWNFNLHYSKTLEDGSIKEVSMFFEVQNIFDKTYIATANNISNSIDSTGAEDPGSVLADRGGSIYAGAPRTFLGGMKLKF